MNIEKNICPVPQDQRPINEYLALKDTFGFSWTTKSQLQYYKDSLKICLFVWGGFSLLVNDNNDSWINVIVYSTLWGSCTLFLFYMRIYLGWSYIYTRLMQATIAYEESGWYDGQIWVKTPEILIQDKLTGQYQVKPILDKIKKTLFIFLFLVIVTLYYIYMSSRI